ncbi:MAG: hypothetical protein SNJ71_00195 [Bacteroidales bacterium]
MAIKTIPQLLADINTYITHKIGLIRKAEHGNLLTDIVESMGDLTTLTWNKITGKPTTFPPATHNHDYFDIVSENPVRIKKGSYEIISPTTDTVNSYIAANANGRIYLVNNDGNRRLDLVNQLNFQDGDIAVYNSATQEFEPLILIENDNVIRSAHYNVTSNITLCDILPGYKFEVVIHNITNNDVGIDLVLSSGGNYPISNFLIQENTAVKPILVRDFGHISNILQLYIASGNWNSANLTIYVTQTKMI